MFKFQSWHFLLCMQESCTRASVHNEPAGQMMGTRADGATSKEKPTFTRWSAAAEQFSVVISQMMSPRPVDLHSAKHVVDTHTWSQSHDLHICRSV